MTYLRNRKVALLIMRLTFILKSSFSVPSFLKATVSSEPVHRLYNTHFYIYELLTPFYTSILISFFLSHLLFVCYLDAFDVSFTLPPSDMLETLLNVQEFCVSLARQLIA